MGIWTRSDGGIRDVHRSSHSSPSQKAIRLPLLEYLNLDLNLKETKKRKKERKEGTKEGRREGGKEGRKKEREQKK